MSNKVQQWGTSKVVSDHEQLPTDEEKAQRHYHEILKRRHLLLFSREAEIHTVGVEAQCHYNDNIARRYLLLLRLKTRTSIDKRQKLGEAQCHYNDNIARRYLLLLRLKTRTSIDKRQKLGEAESGHIGMRMDMTQKYFGG